jgi:hypothetical protein
MKLTFILSLCCCLLLSSWSFRAKRTKYKNLTFRVSKHAYKDGIDNSIKTIKEFLDENSEGEGTLILLIDEYKQYLQAATFQQRQTTSLSEIGTNDLSHKMSYEIIDNHFFG